MCGSFLCATNLWATFMKRPHVCFQTWAKFTIVRKKTNTQAFILFLALLIIMVCSAIMSCYYQADLMLANASTLIHYLFPYTTVGTEVQPMMFWMALIIRDLTMLAYSLYSALACSIMIEFYVYVTALHQDLLTICKKQHLQSELRIWRRKFGCFEKFWDLWMATWEDLCLPFSSWVYPAWSWQSFSPLGKDK